MSLVVFSHIITAVLSALLVISLVVMNYRKIDKKSLLKPVLFTILITTIFWIPFLALSYSNHIALPGISWQLTGVSFNDLITGIFSNSVYVPYINITAFIGLILSIINYKRLCKYYKQIFWIAVILIIVASPLFPWNLLNNTFVRSTFQRPHRLYVISQLLLCFLFSECVISLCKNKKTTNIMFYIHYSDGCCHTIIRSKRNN